MPTPFSISDSLGEAPSIAQSAGGVKSLIHSPWLSRPGLRPPMKITTTNLCRRFPPSQNQNALPAMLRPRRRQNLSCTNDCACGRAGAMVIPVPSLYQSLQTWPLDMPTNMPATAYSDLDPFSILFHPAVQEPPGRCHGRCHGVGGFWVFLGIFRGKAFPPQTHGKSWKSLLQSW